MKNFFCNVYKYPIEGETKIRKDARYFLLSDFKDLYKLLSKYGPLNSYLESLLEMLTGKISMCYLLNIITEEERNKLYNYVTLFKRKNIIKII